MAGISQLAEGNFLHDVGFAVQTVARGGRVRRGAGVRGPRHRHQDARGARRAQLLARGAGAQLRTGMVFAVEPMVNVGTADTVQLDDGWTVVTADGSLSAHFEHTIAVTDNGPEILTLA